MNNLLKAPQVDSYIYSFKLRSLSDISNIDKESLSVLDKLFHELEAIVPNDDVYQIYISADRGTFEDYYKEMYDEEFDESLNKERILEEWESAYSEEQKWFSLTAVSRNGYRIVMLNNSAVISTEPNQIEGYINIHKFIEWMISGVKESIKMIQDGTYNDVIEKQTSYRDRYGTISRKDWWTIFPEYKEDYFSDISKEEIDEFIKIMSDSNNQKVPSARIKDMTANMFFEYCSLGYKANEYNGTDGLTPKEQYLKFADGRDGGLCEIDGNSPEAFKEWFYGKERFGSHPWEVCRGGNSTHIDLFVSADDSGYYLVLAGKSYGRSNETIKFYIALKKNNIPVYLRDGEAMLARVLETDKIGIVPHDVHPVYCEGEFPNDKILDFRHLPYDEEPEKIKLVIEKAEWFPLEMTQLKKESSEN